MTDLDLVKHAMTMVALTFTFALAGWHSSRPSWSWPPADQRRGGLLLMLRRQAGASSWLI